MDIRYLNIDEKTDIIPLYMEAFEDSKMYVDYYTLEFSKKTDTVAAFTEGKIVSMASIHYKKIIIDKVCYNAGYIYGVTTDKNYRKMGLMNEVISYIVKSLLSKEIKLIYLIPSVAPDIYRSSGFSLLRDEKVFNIYDENMSHEYLNLEKNYTNVDNLKKHLKEIIATYNLGYIRYNVFPIMIYENDLKFKLFGPTKDMPMRGEDVNISINDITSIEDIYGVFPNNEYV